MEPLYKTDSLALLIDLYELTMAYGYWMKGMADREAVFHLSFRKKPFGGSFAIAAGLEQASNYIENFRFEQGDLAYLASLRSGEKPLFDKKFLDYLKNFRFRCDLDAMPEGTPVFPYEPLLRVQGPILDAQLLESILLNIINFQSLIATKAARISWAAKSDEVVEFGLRRAQGIDGAISASRAAHIGGCHSTSHVLAGKLFDIPVKGTQAHSWIMAFNEEEESFRAFVEIMPDNCILLVDTYDSVKGTKHAIKIAEELQKREKKLCGVRLDSGDLAHLSIQIRKLLDGAGFSDVKIMASNELDEHIISDLKQQGAKITIWGVGTNLVTGKDQPALDGVYKLSAVQDAHGKWQHKIKISEQIAKVTDPGVLQVRRFFDENGYIADMLYDIHTPLAKEIVIVDPFDPSAKRRISPQVSYHDLLVPIFKRGKRVYNHPKLSQMRATCIRELEKLSPSMRRFLNPQPYFTGLEKSLHEIKLKMIDEIKAER
jgi:nicotinate phosphoribosyltransferase